MDMCAKKNAAPSFVDTQSDTYRVQMYTSNKSNVEVRQRVREKQWINIQI